MRDAPGHVDANDRTLLIDTAGIGVGGARNVDSGEVASVEQKAVGGAPGGVVPDDVTLRVDTEGFGECGARDVNCGEAALVK